jgi:hypothetical protein
VGSLFLWIHQNFSLFAASPATVVASARRAIALLGEVPAERSDIGAKINARDRYANDYVKSPAALVTSDPAFGTIALALGSRSSTPLHGARCSSCCLLMRMLRERCATVFGRARLL